VQAKSRTSERIEIRLPIRVEWIDEKSNTRVVEEGTTENIGLNGALVHLPRQLPQVGGTVQLFVMELKGKEILEVKAQVLRIERNAAHPLAALKLSDPTEDWIDKVYNNKALIDSFNEDAEKLYEE
jgi:hypothetical protein